MKFPILLAALITVSAAAFTPLTAQAQPHVSVIINTAPPAPIYERVPGPRHGYVWAPGYWEWRSHRHAWVPGHYVSARPGYVYASPSWHHRGGRWVMEPQRWNRGPSHHYGPPPVYVRDHRDRDRDRHHGRDRHDRNDRHDKHDRNDRHDRHDKHGRGHDRGHDRHDNRR